MLKAAWDVLVLFLIPVGGGIPSGVLLARDRGLVWPLTVFLYFISDVILALIFEPLMLGIIAAGKRSEKVARFAQSFKKATEKTTSGYGPRLGPLSLIAISFGVDPMTGRSVARARGHGFISGWTLAISGDLLYFGLLMASTLWLDGILGDGSKTTVIILVAMFVLPPLIRKVREAFNN